MSEPRTVMVVDDDADISDAIASALEDSGYSVITAANGQEALHKLRNAVPQPDLILLDLMMPGMDGWQFRAAQTVDPALSHVPVVLLSAHIDIVKIADELSAAGWLKKPVDLSSLLNTVANT